jgi:ABC-type Fe3+-hydroxamate transport system substrate-binding protein
VQDSPFWSGRDAVDRAVVLPRRPERIVSLVPSQTELLLDLGVDERLVGRTRYCIHPAEKVASVTVVGGTKRADLKLIANLQPDLILGEKEENPKEMVEALAEHAPVYVTDVVSIASAVAMCRDVGRLVGLGDEAQRLAGEIERAMNGVRNIAHRTESVLYLIWRRPWMAAGAGTFIHSCLEHIGLRNVAAEQPARYPELSVELLTNLKPDRVYLSSEPFPFNETHVREVGAILPNAKVQIVDGELFSWYGSRMLRMPAYWRSLTSG